MALSAGQMRERVRFERRILIYDGYGNTEDIWDEASAFERAAGYLMKPGSEAVLAQRLEGRQPVTIYTRFDSQTSKVTTGWRLTDVRTGVVYDIHGAGDMDRKRQWMTFVCEAGGQA